MLQPLAGESFTIGEPRLIWAAAALTDLLATPTRCEPRSLPTANRCQSVHGRGALVASTRFSKLIGILLAIAPVMTIWPVCSQAAHQPTNAEPPVCAMLLIYFAGGFPSAFLNMVMKAVTDS